MASLKSLRSFNLNLNPILQNRLVLYFLLFIAIVDLFYSLQTSDFTAVFIFLIVGFVTSMFSRNMIAVLSIALAGSHLIRFGTKISEGLENKDEEKDKKNKKGNKNKKTDEEDNDDDEEELLDGIEEKADRDKLKDLITNREKVNEDFSKMSGTADKIVNSLKELQPLITQTESFVEKYSDYAKLGENLKNKYA
jgi:hypothetical protein